MPLLALVVLVLPLELTPSSTLLCHQNKSLRTLALLVLPSPLRVLLVHFLVVSLLIRCHGAGGKFLSP